MPSWTPSYREDDWTVREVVHHVVDSHINAYVRFRWSLTEDEPMIKPYEEKEWARLTDAIDAPGGGVTQSAGCAPRALAHSSQSDEPRGLRASLGQPGPRGAARRCAAADLRVAREAPCGAYHGATGNGGVVRPGFIEGPGAMIER